MQGCVTDLRGQPRSVPDMHVFFRHAATFSWRSQAAWFVAQMIRWGQIEKANGLEHVIDAVYRPDLYREVAADLGIAAPIPMASDRFLDGMPFDPGGLPRYLERLEISSLRIRLDELPGSLESAR